MNQSLKVQMSRGLPGRGGCGSFTLINALILGLEFEVLDSNVGQDTGCLLMYS